MGPENEDVFVKCMLTNGMFCVCKCASVHTETFPHMISMLLRWLE